MKNISIIRYYNEYIWLRIDQNIATVGVSEFAQQQWGEMVFIQLPFMGQFCKQGTPFGAIKSLLNTDELPMPVDGLVLKTNARLETEPNLMNKDPLGEGWILRIKVLSPDQMEKLLTERAYQQIIQL
jgi:glycine cleavage system H protein